jgi:hypothetical protein
MPGIFEVRCDSCDYKVGGSSYMAVVMPDGSEEVCPHPMEFVHAEFVTREKWSTLVRQGRIRYKEAMFCRECGAVDYYGPDHPERILHVSNLVHISSSGEAQRFHCLSCGKNELSSLVWGRGCLLGLVEKTGLLKKIVISCPKCKKGKLTSEVVAFS